MPKLPLPIPAGLSRFAHPGVIAGVLGALILGGLGLAAVNRPGSPAGPGGGPGGMPPTPVVAVRSQRAPIAEVLSLVGTLAADEVIDMTMEIDGVVETIEFEEGERVLAGRRLITLDRAKLQAALDEAQAQSKLALSTRERFEALGDGGAVSRQEVDRSIAEAEVEQAAVALAEALLEDATIRAPFDGVMGAREISPGQFVERGQVLTTLISQDPMKAEFRVPERFLSQVREGQRIEVQVVAYPADTFTGEVYFIDPQIEEATRTALVKARVPNTDGRLRRGMFASLTLIVTVRPDAIIVPETALMWEGELASLFVVNPDRIVERRAVSPGVRRAGIVEIAEGLSAGETVVVEGLQKIGPGAPVELRLDERPLVSPSGVPLPGSRNPDAGRPDDIVPVAGRRS